MNNESQLITELERRLGAVKGDDTYSRLYTQSIKKVVDHLKNGYYRNLANQFRGSDELIYDLRVLGYFDLAQEEVKRQFER